MKSIDISDFADQDKITFGLGYILTLKSDRNDVVFLEIKELLPQKLF